MAVLRFPNPGSDFQKMVATFKTIFAAARSTDGFFDLDFAVKALIDAGQVSSSGAVGAEALRRSTRDDRSRDPLYNQLKMYSEVYRMLGWLRPGYKRLLFQPTLLAEALCEELSFSMSEAGQRLAAESLLGIVFPNPNTANIGVTNSRPFPMMLRLIRDCDGLLTRDELIISMLATVDDRATGAYEAAVERVRGVRGSEPKLAAALRETADGNQVNTLQNYTRFPIGAVQSPIIGWATSERVRGLYRRPVVALTLTAEGERAAAWCDSVVDVRESDIEGFPDDARAHFANFSFYGMLERVGHDLSSVADERAAAAAGSAPVLERFGRPAPTDILYSPMQQAPDDILRLANKIESEG